MIKVKMLATCVYEHAYYTAGCEYELTDGIFENFQGKCVVINKTAVVEADKPVKKVIRAGKTTAMKSEEVEKKDK